MRSGLRGELSLWQMGPSSLEGPAGRCDLSLVPAPSGISLSGVGTKPELRPANRGGLAVILSPEPPQVPNSQ